VVLSLVVNVFNCFFDLRNTYAESPTFFLTLKKIEPDLVVHPLRCQPSLAGLVFFLSSPGTCFAACRAILSRAYGAWVQAAPGDLFYLNVFFQEGQLRVIFMVSESVPSNKVV
jgi:hypothetical protein